jgi:hypothetical protein
VTYTVHYSRFGGRYYDSFPTFADAVEFIEAQEDREQIFALWIGDDVGPLWESDHPLASTGRWRKVSKRAPDWDWSRA